MSLATRAGDLFYTFRFLRMLVTPFDQTDAFKLGLIDANGKRIKTEKIDNSEKKSAYTTFHRLVFNIKRLMAKVPGGQSKLASYAAALFLIKEEHNLSDKNIEKILNESGLSPLDFLAEDSKWFLLEDNMLSPGIYQLRNEKVPSDGADIVFNPKDKIMVENRCYPVGEILGLNIYSVTHINSNKEVHITLGEIYK